MSENGEKKPRRFYVLVALLLVLGLALAFPQQILRTLMMPLDLFFSLVEKSNWGPSRDAGAAAIVEARNEQTRLAAEEARLAAAVVANLPSAPFRIQRKKDDVEIFLSRNALESVPFPDRDGLFARIGRVWCSDHPGLLWRPTVSFRDIKSGATFGEYSCRESRASVRAPE